MSNGYLFIVSGASVKKHCCTCKVELDQPNRPDTDDCGGDCVRCMAECYDPDCMATMREIEPNEPKWRDE